MESMCGNDWSYELYVNRDFTTTRKQTSGMELAHACSSYSSVADMLKGDSQLAASHLEIFVSLFQPATVVHLVPVNYMYM